MVYIYHAERYTGELSSSEEGQVCWISEKEFLEKDLAPGMETVVESDDCRTGGDSAACFIAGRKDNIKKLLLPGVKRSATQVVSFLQKRGIG